MLLVDKGYNFPILFIILDAPYATMKTLFTPGWLKLHKEIHLSAYRECYKIRYAYRAKTFYEELAYLCVAVYRPATVCTNQLAGSCC